jgi:hypothetical protein
MSEATSIRNFNQSYTLDDNPLEGFNRAVYNGQQRLALEYAVLLFDHLFYGDRNGDGELPRTEGYQGQLDILKSELETIKAALAPSRKITKGNAPVPERPMETKPKE